LNSAACNGKALNAAAPASDAPRRKTRLELLTAPEAGFVLLFFIDISSPSLITGILRPQKEKRNLGTVHFISEQFLNQGGGNNLSDRP